MLPAARPIVNHTLLNTCTVALPTVSYNTPFRPRTYEARYAVISQLPIPAADGHNPGIVPEADLWDMKDMFAM